MTQTPLNASRPASVRVCEGGRIVIPAEVRGQLGLKVGDRLVLRVEDGEIHLFTGAAGMRKSTTRVFEVLKARGSLASDELIAERRAEAAREAPRR